MPQILSNFDLRSKLPNFVRDSFVSIDAMTAVNSDWIDEGHISYCKENGKHYIFKSVGGNGVKLEGLDRWTLLVPDSLSDVDSYIDANVIYKVDNVSSLTDNLSSLLSCGRIVYVKDTQQLYYNTY